MNDTGTCMVKSDRSPDQPVDTHHYRRICDHGIRNRSLKSDTGTRYERLPTWSKHHLEVIDTLNDDGTLSAEAQIYVGLDRFEARKKL